MQNTIQKTRFGGFTPNTLDFFRRLDKNNNREWFAEHKPEYQKSVAEPFKQLAVELAPMVQELDPLIFTDPRRTVSRIYRDTRFASDKTPYRPNIWIAFKRNSDCWTATPVFFFEITATHYMTGMGIYQADAATMRNFRQQIDHAPQHFREIIKTVCKNKTIKLEAEQYKRPLSCEHLPREYRKAVFPWYQCKTTLAVIGTYKPDKILYSPKLTDFIIDKFVFFKPLYDFLWRAAAARTSSVSSAARKGSERKQNE
ncbi:MAG: DUF2461 domain-containing protein [Planctomycetaceae bacterium]|jgi:uncharacterized protein (TIGR02453 family)|nr:DUF2461 domain-containing protein [Planctomycetaceae bacterium]